MVGVVQPLLLRNLVFFLVFLIACSVFSDVSASPFDKKNASRQTSNAEQSEFWGYVNVRPNAFMFWWLYMSNGGVDKPLIMWLQGGPGGSSTGFGNFEEIGPQNVQLKPRNTTWLKEANLLFVDNPVGAGYSYVTKDDAYTTNVEDIATDLVTLFKAFMSKMPQFKNTPFYIFSESYGGKMTAAFGAALYQEIQSGGIKCNFKGVALGDSWISPIDSVLTWAPYLYQMSLLDEKDLQEVTKVANLTAKAVAEQLWKIATDLLGELESVIAQATDNVDVYNILAHHAPPFPELPQGRGRLDRLYASHVGRLYSDSLTALMNGPIRKKLGIIPDNVTWGGQSSNVFTHLSVDFMKPVIGNVSLLLYYGLKVVVYQGQLDMICNTPGAELWLKRLHWWGSSDFQEAKRKPLYSPSQLKTRNTGAFVKSFKNLDLYYILKAGHMVPSDNGEMALKMVKRVLAGQ